MASQSHSMHAALRDVPPVYSLQGNSTRNTENPTSVVGDISSLTDMMNTRESDATPGNSTINPTETESINYSKVFQGWSPLVLRDSAFLGFILCFVVFLVALVALEVVDSKHNGLATTENNKHYLWTYGPTASNIYIFTPWNTSNIVPVLSVVMSFWGQVEHRTKQLLPWSILRTGPTPASSTLLLEYVTLSQPEALFKSLKQGQWAVSLAIIGSILLKMLTVASTGLLTLQTERVTIENCNLIAKDRFTSDIDATLAASWAGLTISALSNGNLSVYPAGTSETAAFPSIGLPESFQGANVSSIEVSVDVFHADLECETGFLEPKTTLLNGTFHNPDPSSWMQRHNGTSTDPELSTDKIYSLSMAITALFDVKSKSCKTYFGEISPKQFVGDVVWGFGQFQSLGCSTASTGSNSTRMIFAVAKLQQRHGDIVMSPDNFFHKGYDVEVNLTNLILNQTVLSCMPTYTINRTLLEVDAKGNLLQMKSKSEGVDTEHIRLFNESALVQMYGESLNISATDNPKITSTTTYHPFLQDPTFQLFQTRHSHQAIDASLNRTILEDAAKTQFSAVSAQWVKQSFMKAEETQIKGKCHGTQQRLRLNNFSLRTMQAVLAILTALVAGLWASRPKNVISRDPGSIGGLITIFAHSLALQKQLSGQGISTLGDIYSKIHGYQCKSSASMTVELSPIKNPQQEGIPPSKTSPPWKPFSVSTPFVYVIILLLISFIAGLEVTFRVSQAQHGLGTVEGHSYAHFVWTYVPALMMLCIQLCVGAIAFSYLFLAPYGSLKNKLTSTRDVLLRDYLSRTAVQSFLNSGLSRDLAIFPIALSLLLTPILTIAVSGLFTIEATQNSHPTNVTITSAFNNTINVGSTSTESYNQVNDDITWAHKRPSLLALYFTSNYSLPAWTFGGFVFPEVRLEDAKLFNADDGRDETGSPWNHSTLTVPLSALRPNLDCSITDCRPEKNFHEYWNCRSLPGCPRLELAYDLISHYEYRESDKPFSMIGFTIGGFENNTSPHIPKKCPNMIGRIGLNTTNFTTFICRPSVSEMTVITELSLPSYAIMSMKPNESTSRQVLDNALWSPDGLFAYSDYLNELVPNLFVSPSDDKSGSRFTTFFQAIMARSGHTPNTWPVEEFLGEENFPRLAESMEDTFRIIISDAISAGLRTSAANNTPPITGTITKPNVWRLHQNEVSTRILQGLLAAITLCVATTFFLMDVQSLLPKNPCSIAAAASLLADSDMLKPEITPADAVWMSDAELKKAGVWNGYVFSLGWWSRDGEEMRFGIDAGRAEQGEI